MKADKAKLSDLPPIHFQRSRRARHLNIRIKPYKGVVVSVPVGMSMASAERFVLQKRDWIVRTLQKVKQLEAPSVLYDGTQTIRTRSHRLSVQPRRLQAATCRISKGIIHVCYPLEMPVTATEVQTAIRAGLVAAYRKEAKEILPGWVAELAREYGFNYNRIFIKNHRSRWGSCSEKNNINLSLHLMRLPDHLVDYVILHELVHTEIKNHSRRFWQRLAEVCPRAEMLRKELRRQARTLKPLH
ncbi:MAG: M48 family metallopeptidase [bacterium]